jgi:hypothetical protein
MTEVVVIRERSTFPLSRITLYNDLDRVELRNELDPKVMPFPGGIITGTILTISPFRSTFRKTTEGVTRWASLFR